MSGTSMVCPHVVGHAAVLMSLESIEGDRVCDRLKALALKGVVTGAPEDTSSDLLFNGNPEAE